MNLSHALTRLRRALAAPLPALGLVAAVGPLAMASGSAPPAHPAAALAEATYHGLPALPEGSDDRSVGGVVESALALADALNVVTTDDAGAECPADLLFVSWEEPGDGYDHGAHVTPIGPAPDEDTTDVNGVVLCEASDVSYMGFEARWSEADERWDVVAVPDIGDESHEQLVEHAAPVVPAGPEPVPVLAAPGTVAGPIEGYAAYEPQRTCDGSPKPGTRSLAAALLRDYPGSRNLGIVRGCSVGGRSEHKEGRAFDWGVNIGNPTEKAAAESFIGALMATDADGNRHALARRMGVMYVIWDRQIWSSYRAGDGWRPYSGASAHRDHVHISLSWAGAQGRTSFWSGTVPLDLPTASPTVATARTAATAATGAPTSSASSATADAVGHVRGRRGDDARAAARALWEDGTPPTAEELTGALVAHGMSDEDAARAAARWTQREGRHEHRRGPTGDLHESDGDGDGAGDARRQVERDERDRARVAEEERGRAAWREHRDAREAEHRQREDERTERREDAEELRDDVHERDRSRQAAEREARRAQEAARRQPASQPATEPAPPPAPQPAPARRPVARAAPVAAPQPGPPVVDAGGAGEHGGGRGRGRR